MHVATREGDILFRFFRPYGRAEDKGSRRPLLRIHALAALVCPTHRAAPRVRGCLAPYAEPNADRDEDRPEGVREGFRTSTRRDRDCPFGGPAEATEAVREPVRVKARAQMLLGTFGETKVPRLPGRDPAYNYNLSLNA